MSEEHWVELSKHCRVCGSFFKKKKGSQNRKISCSGHKADLLNVFKIEIDTDLEDIHPPSFCHSCNNIIYHTKRKASSGTPYYPTITISTWYVHSEQNCVVCTGASTHSVGGRPKKQNNPGRPGKNSFQSAITHVKSIAPPAFCQQNNVITQHDIFDCPICLEIVNKPIELKECNNLVCADCLCKCLEISRTPSCPCCHLDHLYDLNLITSPPEVTLKAIGSIEVTCCACTKQGLLKYHKAHFDSKCECTHFKPVPLCPSDLLIRPQEMSLTPLEEKLQSSFIKRSMHHSQTLVVKAGGQVGTKLLLLLLLCRT